MLQAHYLTRPLFILMLCLPLLTGAQTKSSFEDLPLDPSTYWNGISASYGDYTSLQEDSIFIFRNNYSRNDYGFGLYESWYGFSYSRMQDDTTAGLANQNSAITAAGAFESENYAVYYLMSGSDTVWLSRPEKLDSVFITNGTYPFLSMQNGDSFSKKFGGETGDDPDWFLLTIRGLRNGEITDSVELYLADYRDSNNDNDYILDEWTKVDLSVLDSVDMIEFSLSSSDVGDYGMNTPAYFCMDNLSGTDLDDFSYSSGDIWDGSTALTGLYNSTFANGSALFSNQYTINDYGFGLMESWGGYSYSNMQDDSTAGYTNQYSAYPAEGANGSANYALCYNYAGVDTITLHGATEVSGVFITNGTQGVKSMQDGDGFAKKFGGENGNDPDWFLLTVKGLYEGTYTDTIDFYLADYRFENNEEDYILMDWRWMDLRNLGTVDKLEFSLSSSDNGAYGMNTPAYFFMDDLNDQAPVVENPISDLIVYDSESFSYIDLSSVFSDPDDDDDAIQLSVKSYSNEGILNASIEDKELTLEYTHQTGEGEIVIEATSNGQVISDSFAVSVIHGLGVEAESIASLRVFPNPTEGKFRIHLNNQENYEVDVYNLYGQSVYSAAHSSVGEEIDISELSSGLYIIRIETNEAIYTQRIRKN